MLAAAGRRLGGAVLTLLLVTLGSFALLHLAPGDPLAGDDEALHALSPADRDELRRMYHLDRPLWERYGRWLADLGRGEMGRSLVDRRPVAERIRERAGLTVGMNLLALGVMVGLALPLGIASAWRPGSRLDRWAGAGTFALYAIPVFWAAVMLQGLLAARLGWLPLYGPAPVGSGPGTVLAHLALPVACLAYPGLAYLVRFVRASVAEALGPTTVRAARARGLSAARIAARHAPRLAAVPLLTLAGFLLPGLLAGSVVVETVFALPGLGGLFVEAVLRRDAPVVLGLTLLSASATLAGIVAADLLHLAADPRMRRG